jgi:hypothetical protein
VPHGSSQRLKDIERVLAQRSSVRAGADADAVAVHLADVDAGRLRAFTVALEQRLDQHVDEIDALVMRMLLNDYTASVGHLRAVAQTAASRIDDAALPVRESRKFLRRLDSKEAPGPAAGEADEPGRAGA